MHVMSAHITPQHNGHANTSHTHTHTHNMYSQSSLLHNPAHEYQNNKFART